MSKVLAAHVVMLIKLTLPPQHRQECVLGLTDRSHLYAGDTQVSSPEQSVAPVKSTIILIFLLSLFLALSAGLQHFLLRRVQRLPPHHQPLTHLPLPPAQRTQCPRLEGGRVEAADLVQ